jgi:DNA-binding response OmpR family regulator
MKKKVLLVDDQQTIGQVLSVYLNSEYEFTYVQNPIRAIEWLQDHDADLIISDIHMPEMDGSEFLSYLKENALLQHIPVVMLSSEESSNERIALLEGGAADFILKPFNPKELKIRINNVIQANAKNI